MSNLRVLFITFEFPPYSFSGGAGIYAFKLIEKMSEKGITIHVVFPIDKKGIKKIPKKLNNRVYLHPIILRKLPGLEYIQFNFKARKYIKKLKNNFNLVHFNFQTLFKVKNVPNIITVLHPIGSLRILLKFIPNLVFSPKFLFEYNPILVKIDSLGLKRSDSIIAISKFSKNWIIENYSINSNKIQVIYLGVDIVKSDINLVENIKNKLNLKGKKVVLFVGRLEYRKGILNLIGAMSKINEIENLKCIIVGTGPLKNKILKYIIKMNTRDRFIFLNRVSYKVLISLYNICDIYVQPSFLEGFGLTIIEAMTACKPVITTKAGSLPELVQNNYNGILINPDDTESLRNKITFLLSNNDFAKKLGENASKTVKRKFNWSKTAENTIKIYKEFFK